MSHRLSALFMLTALLCACNPLPPTPVMVPNDASVLHGAWTLRLAEQCQAVEDRWANASTLITRFERRFDVYDHTGTHQRTFTLPAIGPWAVRDGEVRVVTSNANGHIVRAYDSTSGAQVRELTVPRAFAGVGVPQISDNGARVLATEATFLGTNAPKRLRVFDAHTGTVLTTVESASGPDWSISPDGSALLEQSNDAWRILDATTGRERFRVPRGLGGARLVTFSLDGSTLAVLSSAHNTTSMLRVRSSLTGEDVAPPLPLPQDAFVKGTYDPFVFLAVEGYGEREFTLDVRTGNAGPVFTRNQPVHVLNDRVPSPFGARVVRRDDLTCQRTTSHLDGTNAAVLDTPPLRTWTLPMTLTASYRDASTYDVTGTARLGDASFSVRGQGESGRNLAFVRPQLAPPEPLKANLTLLNGERVAATWTNLRVVAMMGGSAVYFMGGLSDANAFTGTGSAYPFNVSVMRDDR